MSVHEIYWGVLSETTLVKKWIKEVGFVRERNEMVLKLQLRAQSLWILSSNIWEILEMWWLFRLVLNGDQSFAALHWSWEGQNFGWANIFSRGQPVREGLNCKPSAYTSGRMIPSELKQYLGDTHNVHYYLISLCVYVCMRVHVCCSIFYFYKEHIPLLS